MKPTCVTSSTKMPSSGSAARIASRKPICGASFAHALAPPRLTLDQLLAPGGSLRVVARQHIDEPAQDRCGIADQRHRRWHDARGFLGIRIDPDDRQVVVDAPLGQREEQPRADGQHDIGFAPELASERQRDAQRIAALQHALAAAEADAYGRLQHARERGHLRRGVLRAAAADDERPLGGAEALRRRQDRVLVEGGGRRRERPGGLDRSRAAPDIHRALQRRRAGAPARHGGHGLGDQARRLVGRADPRREIDQAGEDAGLVADLMQVTESAADGRGRDLADQRQHRGVHAVGREQGGRRVEQPRARHHRIGLRPAGREGCAERHVGGALLVACVHRGEPVGRLEQRVEQRVVLHARQRIDGGEAMCDQRRQDRLGGRHRIGHAVLCAGAFRSGWPSVQIAAGLSRDSWAVVEREGLPGRTPPPAAVSGASPAPS
ncbi:MAG: hypothetical protein M5U07_00765 [Xanthobacteraceae bacterium]|nr:hypothetical protein [Xanthobacteraceae bacterium]